MDLRQINEEQFKLAYNYLKEETNEFTSLDIEFLKDNPQFLLIARLVIGLSQAQFSKAIGNTNLQWVRHFEAGRQGIKYSEYIPKCIDLLNSYFRENKVLPIDQTLKFWKRAQVAREKFYFKPSESNYRIKKISQMTVDDAKDYFEFLKKETDNFSKFDPDILIHTPQFITIFRLILNLSHRSLALAMGKDPRKIRQHEYKEYKIMLNTANEYMRLFESLFNKHNLVSNVDINNYLGHFKRITYYDDLELSVEKSFGLIKNDHMVIFKHQNLTINRKTMNFDFFVSLDDKPFLIVEVTKLKYKERKDLNNKFAYLDHRFQLIKLKYPNVKTMIIIQVDGKQQKLVKRVAERELINTNYCIIINSIKSFEGIFEEIVTTN
jgi:hypothetical protein